MSVNVAGREFRIVAIVDDEDSARNSYGFTIEDLDLEPDPWEGPLHDVAKCVEKFVERSDAAICDHHLRVRDYSQFDGAELVAACYGKNFPAILCTRWGAADIDSIRDFRRYIPVLLKPDELNPDSVIRGFEICVREFGGDLAPNRRPWRAQIRVEDVGESGLVPIFYFTIVGWDVGDIVRLPMDALPAEIRPEIKEGARLHVHVNTGAESDVELYFESWERD